MDYRDAAVKLADYRQEIADIRAKMRAVQNETAPDEVEDYTFETVSGTIALSQLFRDKDDLIVIHNMGRACPYCTLWADGFSGVYAHLADRAAFVVSSPDPPDIQRRFAEGRGWRFPMVSHRGNRFAADMGYRSENGWLPGVSVFRKEGGRLLRVADTGFSPGDDFCGVWHLLDLLPAGADGWQPRFDYSPRGGAS